MIDDRNIDNNTVHILHLNFLVAFSCIFHKKIPVSAPTFMSTYHISILLLLLNSITSL